MAELLTAAEAGERRTQGTSRTDWAFATTEITTGTAAAMTATNAVEVRTSKPVHDLANGRIVITIPELLNRIRIRFFTSVAEDSAIAVWVSEWRSSRNLLGAVVWQKTFLGQMTITPGSTTVDANMGSSTTLRHIDTITVTPGLLAFLTPPGIEVLGDTSTTQANKDIAFDFAGAPMISLEADTAGLLVEFHCF